MRTIFSENISKSCNFGAFFSKVRTILKLLVPVRTIFNEAGYLPGHQTHSGEATDGNGTGTEQQKKDGNRR